MHDDARDLLRVGESDVRPRFAAVDRSVHSVALRDVGAHVRLARADIDDVRIGWRHRDRADRSDRLRIEDRLPRAARVIRFPHAAVHAAEIEMLRLSRHASDREHATRAKRTNAAPVRVDVHRR